MSWFRQEDDRDLAAGDHRSGRDRRGVVDASQLLAHCCRRDVRAFVVCPEHTAIASGRFKRLMPQGVLLELDGPVDERTFPPLALATVSFTSGGRARVFMAPILEVEAGDEGGAPLIRLALPDEIAGADGRTTFRVPITPEGALVARLLLGEGTSVEVRPLNISQSGILVELPGGTGLELAKGRVVEVELRLDEEEAAVQVEAVVRRRSGREYGLFFPLAVARGAHAASKPLRDIVRELETRWLRSRVPDALRPEPAPRRRV